MQFALTLAILVAMALAPPAHSQASPPPIKLLASNGMAGDNYGQGVAIDGDRAVVGAPESDPGPGGVGTIYVYERTGGSWTETAKLIPLDPQLVQLLGFDVDLSGDLIVGGADFDDEGIAVDDGGGGVAVVAQGVLAGGDLGAPWDFETVV